MEIAVGVAERGMGPARSFTLLGTIVVVVTAIIMVSVLALAVAAFEVHLQTALGLRCGGLGSGGEAVFSAGRRRRHPDGLRGEHRTDGGHLLQTVALTEDTEGEIKRRGV